jgi:hypothetical protein
MTKHKDGFIMDAENFLLLHNAVAYIANMSIRHPLDIGQVHSPISKKELEAAFEGAQTTAIEALRRINGR